MQLDQQLSPHFCLSEFTFSQAAVRLGLRNEPLSNHIANLGRLALVLEEARHALGDVPLLISSGFRSAAVNKAVGGAVSPPSAHLDGRAADFTAPAFGTPRQICQRLVDYGLTFDQLIFEGTWVHLGIAPFNDEPRGQVLSAWFHPGEPTTYSKGLR
jgi:zinc D-Ala-D-Ala carboxypeptidase